MTKFLSSPVIVSLIGFIATIVVALLNNRKKDPEYMAIMKGLIENVFSRFHFEVNDLDADTTKIHEFLEYLDEQKYSGYLIELYAAATKIVDIASNDPGSYYQQAEAYKRFAKKYKYENKKVRRSLGMKGSIIYLIFDNTITLTMLIATLSYASIYTGDVLKHTSTGDFVNHIYPIFSNSANPFWGVFIIFGFSGLCMAVFLLHKHKIQIEKLSRRIELNSKKPINIKKCTHFQ